MRQVLHLPSGTKRRSSHRRRTPRRTGHGIAMLRHAQAVDLILDPLLIWSWRSSRLLKVAKVSLITPEGNQAESHFTGLGVYYHLRMATSSCPSGFETGDSRHIMSYKECLRELSKLTITGGSMIVGAHPSNADR